jgi:phosphoglycolate phosphatase
VTRYKLAVFDFDGTLADSFPWFRRVLNDVAEKYRFKPVADDETESLRGMSAREILVHLRIPRWKVPVIARHMRALMAQEIHHVQPFPGIDAMLRRLSERGIALAIASSNTEANVRRVLDATASLVDHYACGSSIFGKSAKLKMVLRWSGLHPDDVIYIGDEIRDFEAARRLRIGFGAVAWGYTRPDTLAALSPRLMFTRVDEIAQQVGIPYVATRVQQK